MDLLEDILKQAGLRSRVLGHRSFSKATSLQFPCAKSIGFHCVTQGQAFIHTDSKAKPLILQKGDIALMARGCDHVVSTQEKWPRHLTPLSEFEKGQALAGGSSKPLLTIASGAYQFWNTPMHPLFTEIPDWYVIRYEDVENFDRMQAMIKLLTEEVADPKLGSDRIVQGILDILFSLIFRKIVEQSGQKISTWSHALQDLQIRRAMELMHSHPAQNWTLEDLAKQVGLSRAGFAQKFKSYLGDTPLHYLTTIRIQKAMELLSSTDDNIESVALAVGYQDAFGFSKAFKKKVGFPPREFRARDTEEKKVAWRLP